MPKRLIHVLFGWRDLNVVFSLLLSSPFLFLFLSPLLFHSHSSFSSSSICSCALLFSFHESELLYLGSAQGQWLVGTGDTRGAPESRGFRQGQEGPPCCPCVDTPSCVADRCHLCYIEPSPNRIGPHFCIKANKCVYLFMYPCTCMCVLYIDVYLY